jgi:hypothetical protein
MKIFRDFILNSTNQLCKPEYQLSLILLDLYRNSADGVFKIDEVRKHPLMNPSLDSQVYKIGTRLSGKKIMNRYLWDYTNAVPDEKIKKQEAEFILFDKVEVDRLEVAIVVNPIMWEYLNTSPSINVNEKAFHEIIKYNNIRLYMWYKTWESSNEVKCSIDWLKMYLDVNVDNRAFNWAYMREFVSMMKEQKINIDIKNIYEDRYIRVITHLLFKVS